MIFCTKRLVKMNDDMSIGRRIILCCSEFGGTACLVFLGCLGCTSPNGDHIPFTFGLALMMSIQIFGHISGAHVNPAVTLASAILGNISLINIPVYIFGQITGAITGYGLVKAVLQNYPSNLCSPTPNQDLTGFQLFLSEFLLTLILIWICCACWDSKNETKQDSVPLRLGFAVTGLAMAGNFTYNEDNNDTIVIYVTSPGSDILHNLKSSADENLMLAYFLDVANVSGANINPARSFAPALLNGTWDHHWVYWTGPILAGLLGAFTYRMIFGTGLKQRDGFSDSVTT